jgi:CRP-like cAMP-binding protein
VQTEPTNGNALLAALSPDEQAVVAPTLERVTLTLRDTIQEADKPLKHVIFPHVGVLSALSVMEDGGVIELATIGREGATGTPLVLGSDRIAHNVIVQVEGVGERMAAADFRRLYDELPGFRRLLLRYTLALFTQVSQASACNRLHDLEARCARWLLMTHDRVDGDTFHLTHEFLGQMLGVARPSVSLAAAILQKAGLISYARGRVVIRDRPGLEQTACECYRIVADEFERILGDST